MLKRKREDVKDMFGWNNFVQPERWQWWLSENTGSTRSQMMTNFPQRKNRQRIDGILWVHVQESVAHLWWEIDFSLIRKRLCVWAATLYITTTIQNCISFQVPISCMFVWIRLIAFFIVWVRQSAYSSAFIHASLYVWIRQSAFFIVWVRQSAYSSAFIVWVRQSAFFFVWVRQSAYSSAFIRAFESECLISVVKR